jgi:hypothetical protein
MIYPGDILGGDEYIARADPQTSRVSVLKRSRLKLQCAACLGVSSALVLVGNRSVTSEAVDDQSVACDCVLLFFLYT